MTSLPVRSFNLLLVCIWSVYLFNFLFFQQTSSFKNSNTDFTVSFPDQARLRITCGQVALQQIVKCCLNWWLSGIDETCFALALWEGNAFRMRFVFYATISSRAD